MQVSHGETCNLNPSIYNKFQRGIHDIEHQVTYSGSNFIFHDSQGFEAGTNKELEVVWKFIEERSIAVELKDQLHAIWYLILILHMLLGDQASCRYCIPMDSPRPLLPTELEFFNKGTGKGESNYLVSHNSLCYQYLLIT